ncbi:PREDICTED: lamina-associated polypeptide 2, isoforms beta/gamma-like isoform X4 [Poecilia mexicana]|uniref:lamina-associated polypeptide 2, isoforms beta/gamma-like isoform X4 n=1 Tax=Poecilia mexicana TaxID=48701 RepID=UPI00072E0552|nr:PREDICTED: lamina-associated polypeptide 2, isoforms beta/gamma-like isoform X4 [Poecilia mexicana]
MSFVQYPAHLSKSRLKSDLVAHNVELPPAGSKKEAYVALHLRHVDQTNAANFSSDDDDQEDVVAGGDPESAEELDPSALTDNDLKALLFKYGVKAGPILASTRAVYENKLRKLLQSAGEGESNEAENAVLYSDSDEEDVSEENEDEEKELVGAQEKKAEALEPNQQQSNEMETWSAPSACSYSKPEHWSRSSRLDNDAEGKDIMVDQADTPKDSTCVKEIKDPGRDILKDLLPDTKTSPTGIYASPRRPIKGAAQRPIQYAYPDTPVSPTTLERREVQRRLVPVYIQVLVFFAVVCILFLIFVNVEDTNGVVDLLESLNQCPDGEDETRDAACGEL